MKLDRSLLAKSADHCATFLQRLVEALRRHLVAASRRNACDTAVQCSRPATVRLRQGACWCICVMILLG
ncbi:hypothetical protein [Burkholderia sp. Leaf177]|uniref:hypothetical protein n=1 Tax=Burkholderia sp. Leaf177 TaxID=1736287 RepID=UPI0012E338B8